MKGAQPNARATHILQLCGIDNTTVLGDAFIGKCYDNEEYPWVRRDLTVIDVIGSNKNESNESNDSDSISNMFYAPVDSYSTSGQLQKMSDQNNLNSQNSQNSQNTPISADKGTCMQCGNNKGLKLSCSSCKNAYYCDKECQKKHWKQHKKYCTFKK